MPIGGGNKPEREVGVNTFTFHNTTMSLHKWKS